MSRSAVAHAFLVSLASAAVLAVTPAARADDKPAGGGAQEAPFRWDVVAVTPDDVPKGWTLLGDDAEPRPAVEKEMADAVKAAAEADKYPIEEAAIHARSLKGAENAAITLTYVDLYKDAGKVPAALKEAAAKKGWGYREVISPTRMVLVAGNEADRDAWVALVGRISAKRLGAAALESMDEEGKRTLAHAALSLEPGTASAHVALAQLDFRPVVVLNIKTIYLPLIRSSANEQAVGKGLKHGVVLALPDLEIVVGESPLANLQGCPSRNPRSRKWSAFWAAPWMLPG